MPAVKLTYNNTDYENEIVAEGGRIEMTHSMAGESLSADSLIVPIITGGKPVRFLAEDQGEHDLFVTADNDVFCFSGDIEPPEYVKNSPGLLYYGNDLLVKHYLHQVNRRSRHEYEMVFYSAVWLLDQSEHVGGLYSGETAEEVISDILGNVVSFTIDDAIKEIQIYGYLPYDKRRNNLMKVLMATGAALKNASDGSLRITQLSDAITGVFDESRVYLGGTVSDAPPATAVQVTEHNFLPSYDEVTLYEGVTLETETIKFSEPIHDLSIINGTILDSSVNHCTFHGAGNVTITGKRYNHVTRIITVGDAPSGIDSDTVRSVTDNTLITANNSIEVAEKLYEYLTKSKVIRQDVIVGAERPGDVVQVIDPYTRALVEACIKSMSIEFGNDVLKATCEFLVGYKPPGAIVGFENHVLLTNSGTWTVPAGVSRIRVIIVGAGNGGQNGGNGTAPSSLSLGLPVVVGQGGKGGAGGEGGYILEINLNVSPGQQFSYICGEGGGSDSAGGETLFGSYSSNLGRRFPYGYSEPKTGLVFGKKGENGVDGRPGNQWRELGEPIEYKGVVYYPGQNGSDYFDSRGTGYGQGGGGGGAAVGNNGGNGYDASYTYSSGVFYFRHGNGGKGADAAPGEAAADYGGGGNGGHGGGGGGYAVGDMASAVDIPGIVGRGGSGGKGGKGGPGCIVIYY